MEKARYRAILALSRLPGKEVGIVPDYPPATEEQLRLTEERLGFALPAALRMLYAEVANGGDMFRDGHVLFGVAGRIPKSEDLYEAMTIDQPVSRSGWRLNERVDAELQRHPGAYVECEERPDRFVPIADLGCSMTAQLDGWTGRLYVAGCGQNLHYYRAERGLPPPDSEDAYSVTISFLASSTEEWIDRKLASAWTGAWTVFGPVLPQCELTPEMVDDEST